MLASYGLGREASVKGASNSASSDILTFAVEKYTTMIDAGSDFSSRNLGVAKSYIDFELVFLALVGVYGSKRDIRRTTTA